MKWFIEISNYYKLFAKNGKPYIQGTTTETGIDFVDLYKIEKSDLLVCAAFVPPGVCNVAIGKNYT